MKTFRIYKHPTQGIEAVKVGFSWPAFFFNWVWMLIKKLWGFAALWFGAYVVLAIIESATQSEAFYLILAVAYFALWLIPAFKGNQWREANLISRGFEHVHTVEASNPDSAAAQMAKGQDQAAKDEAISKSSSKPKPFAGFQDIPDQPRKEQGPTPSLPKGRG